MSDVPPPPPPPPPPPYGAVPSPPPGYAAAPVGYARPERVLPVPYQSLASLGRRFGGAVLTLLLMIVTLFIGYLVWAVIAWTKSTTPAKQLLGMRVVDAATGVPLSFGRMVMRQFVFGVVVTYILNLVTIGIFGIVDAFWIFAGDERRRLLDKMADTLVVRT